MNKRILTLLAAVSTAAAIALPAASAAAASNTFTEVPVQIPTSSPDDAGHPISLDGAIDIPTTGCPCPVVMINHGFLGQWQDSGDVADRLANNGYIVIRYSSRGFGKTPGEVDLIGPKEQQDLLDAVHFVNNEKVPQLVGKVIHNDVGQYGASYGGAQAWSLAASGDPAIRTVVPTDTWSNLYQALEPNDVFLVAYTNGFYATGWDPTAAPVNGALSGNPANISFSAQNNYALEIHRWMAEANSGLYNADIQQGLLSHSVMPKIDRVRVPVFIVQGENDGLFNANQAVQAYQALRIRRVPARLYLGGIGHPPSNGSTTSPEAVHLVGEIQAWFDHYLKHAHNGITKRPPIEYSHTSYFLNSWDGTTRSAYRWPLGPTQTLNLCTTGTAGGTLTDRPCPSAAPAVAINTPSASGYDQEPVSYRIVKSGLQQLTGCGQGVPTCQATPPNLDNPPSVLTYDAAPVAVAAEYAGIPHLGLQVAAADVLPAGLQGGAAAFQLDPKFYDVAPDGTATLLQRGAYAQPLNARVAGLDTLPTHSVDFDANGLSYVLPAGHHLRLTLSTSDVPYLRPTVNPFGVALFAGSQVQMPLATGAFPTPEAG